MKLNSTLAASLFAMATVLSLNVSAASDTPAETKTEKAAAKEQTKPCSCMEEKVGMTSNDKEAMPEKTASAKVNPAFDKTRHYHPRDGGKL